MSRARRFTWTITRSGSGCSKSGRSVRRTRARKFCGAMLQPRARCPGVRRRAARGRCSGTERRRRGPARRNFARGQGSFLSRPDRRAGRGRNAGDLPRRGGEGASSNTNRSRRFSRSRKRSTAKSFHTEPNFIRRGDVATRAARLRRTSSKANSPSAARTISISKRTRPGRSRARTAQSSSARRRNIRPKCSTSSRMCSSLPMHNVVVECPRMGGGFGGKETQARDPCRARRAGGDKNRPQGARAVQSRSGHDDHRQAPSVSRRSSRSASTTTDIAGGEGRSCFQWRLVARSFARGDGPRGVSSR